MDPLPPAAVAPVSEPVVMPAPLPVPRMVPIENKKVEAVPMAPKPAVEPFVPAPLPVAKSIDTKPAPTPPAEKPALKVQPAQLPPPVAPSKVEIAPTPSEGLKPGSSITIPMIGVNGSSTVPSRAASVPDAPVKSLEKQASESLPPLPTSKVKPLSKPETKLAPSEVQPSLAPLPQMGAPELPPVADKVKPTKEAIAAAKPVIAAPAPAISTAPMMIPVPSTPPELPPSVKERLNKTFPTEPKQQGVVRDEKTVQKLGEESAKKLEATVTGENKAPLKPEVSPVLPLPKATELPKAEPIKAAEPVKKDAKLPEPAKPDAKLPELPKAEPIKAAEPGKKDAKLPEPAKPDAKLPELPKAEPIKAAEPVKKEMLPMLPPPPTLPKDLPKPSTSEKLPPAELPNASLPLLPETKVAVEKKPITLPKTEIAPLPKMTGVAAVKPPELPKAPVVMPPQKKEAALPELPLTKPIEAVKLPEPAKPEPKLPELPMVKAVEPAKPIEPAKKESGLPVLPKFPVDNEIKAPAKPALPALDAIIGETKRSSSDIFEPKDGIQSKPLGAAAAPSSQTALPQLPLPEPKPAAPKTPDVKVVNAVKPEAAKEAPKVVKEEATAKPVLPMPAKLPEPAPVKAPEVPALPLPPIKPEANVPPLPLPALPAVKSEAAKEAPKAAKEEAESKPVLPAPMAEVKPAASAGETLSRSVSYEKGKSDLSDAEKANLDAVAEKVKKSKGAVRVVAYASGNAEETSVAKRTSLARALQIRAHLIAKGVDAQSISTQALGNKGDGKADRADVFVK